MVFWSTNFGIWTDFGEVQGDVRPWLMAHWKTRGQLSVRLNELLSLCVTVLELWGKMCTGQLFSQGVDLFALKFYLDRVVPINHSWCWKLETLSYLIVDHIPPRSLVLTLPECDAQTDGWICHGIYSTCKALWLSVKMMENVCLQVEGKGNGIKTVIANMSEIAKALSRPATCTSSVSTDFSSLS